MSSPRRLLSPRVVAAALFAELVFAASAAPDPQVLLQLVDYVAVDYPEAVSDGVVVNAAEYEEMREFGVRIVDLSRELEPRGAVVDAAEELAALIETKSTAEQIVAASRALREHVLAEHPVALVPATPPDLERGATLYLQACASCHGETGHGDGPLAENLEPPPTDFHDRARAMQRSLYGLYNTITLGIAGTGMAAFGQMPDLDRWALAFYVGSLAASDEELAAGAGPLPTLEDSPRLDLTAVTSSTPHEVGERFGAGAVARAFSLRRQPQVLFTSPSPFDSAREQTARAVAEFRSGDRAAASAAALSAYLDGFELVENALSAVDAGLALRAEAEMAAMRAVLGRRDATLQDVERSAAAVLASLAEAERVLERAELTPTVAFTSALVILLREGLEAILILAAIATFMIKTERRDTLVYVHAGWVAALAAGVATWAVSTWLLAISGATRELTEGLTALFAAGVLFYVGFWMHGKLNARRWNEFLRDHVGKALEGGTLWMLTVVSFVAVYREIFETVLFYQALWAQTGKAGQAMVFSGAASAAALLVLFAWLIFKVGVRLPLRQFFGVSAVVMIVLAVIFAGKGVAALQEAGKLPIDPIAFLPRVEILGIYPTWESVAAQAALIALAAVLMVRNSRTSAARAAK